MRMFLRKSRLERDPLAVTMSGVRLGEKALQIGNCDSRVIALIAAKTGLTGTAVIILLDDNAAARVRRAVDDAGAVAEIGVVDRGERPGDSAFDVVVVHDVPHTIGSSDFAVRSGWLQLCHRVLRPGGRLVAIERGNPIGLRALFGLASPGGQPAAADDTVATLTASGFRSVRVIGDREGLRFVEGFKTD
jgi:SAM-dependent methyltransferase